MLVCMAAPKDPPRAYPELPPGGWTVEKVRAAISDLETGRNIEPASRLTRALGRSAVYRLARDQCIDTVLGLPAEVLPAGRSWEGRGLARTVADAARDVMRELLGGGCERWLLELGTMLNLAIGVLGYDTSGERWDPVTLERWPLSAVRLDPYARKMWALTTTGEQEIVPGDGTWVVFAPGGLWNWDAALVRALAEPWVQEAMGMRDLGNRSAADAVAGLDLPLPSGVAPDSDEATAYMTAAQGLQKGKAGLLRPANYPEPRVLDLASKTAGASMKMSIDRVEYRIKVGWLGQDGTTTNQGGSLAKARVLDGVRYDKVEAHVHDLYGQLSADGAHEFGCLSAQVLAPWAALNWGRRDLAPLFRRIVPDLEEDERLAQDAARATAFRLEVRELAADGWPLTPALVQELARVRGVRLPAGLSWAPKAAPELPPTVDPPAPPA